MYINLLDNLVKQPCALNQVSQIRILPKVVFSSSHIILSTHILSCSFLLMVDRSMGHLMTFLYCGNCLVLTGNRNGHACSWHSISQSKFLSAALGTGADVTAEARRSKVIYSLFIRRISSTF